MSVIQAAHYGETERRLAKDPIVIAMAKGLADVPRDQLVHDGADDRTVGTGQPTPRFEFMQSANAEYRERGGKDGGHIGAVAHALLLVLDSEDGPKPTKVVTYFAGRSVPSARGDEDRAMTSVSIASNEPDEKAARKALVDYMVHDEAGALADRDWAADRVAAIYAAVPQVQAAKFAGGQPREAQVWDCDGIQFELVRIEREAG